MMKLSLMSVVALSSTLHAAPSTRVIHDRALVVHMLDDLVTMIPFSIPQQALKQRVVSDVSKPPA